MNTTTASYSSEHSWTPGPSRRDSTETILSIQGKETDYVRDTSDTETESEGERDVEFEPVTDQEDDAPLTGESSGQSDNDIIRTKVIEVSVRDDGDLEFADSEQTDSEPSDSENDLYDYWTCAQCRAANNNPLYRYCAKCFEIRKNLFPPRPKRKQKRKPLPQTEHAAPVPSSQDSGVESPANSQELGLEPSVEPSVEPQCSARNDSEPSNSESRLSENVFKGRPHLKRRAESVGRDACGSASDSEEDSDSGKDGRAKRARRDVKPLVKTTSDPAITVVEPVVRKLTKRAIANSLKERLASGNDDTCIVCLTEPKSGIFVHGRIAHICCCYKCSVKVWAKAKRCPVCNCKVSNVLRAVVM